MEFEWDETKREKTLAERGIDFWDAVLIWDDPFRQERVEVVKTTAKQDIKRLEKGR